MRAVAPIAEDSPPPRQAVHIVEDDEQFRLSLQEMFQSLSIEVDAYADAEDFFARAPREMAGCVLLDVRLPGVNGIEFQREPTSFSMPSMRLSPLRRDRERNGPIAGWCESARRR